MLTSLVAKAQVAQGSFSIPASSSFRDLQCSANLNELGRRAFRKTQLELNVLVRCSLEGSKASSYTLAQHHPVLDVSVGCLSPGGELDHRVGLVGQTKAKRVNGNPVIELV